MERHCGKGESWRLLEDSPADLVAPLGMRFLEGAGGNCMESLKEAGGLSRRLGTLQGQYGRLEGTAGVGWHCGYFWGHCEGVGGTMRGW